MDLLAQFKKSVKNPFNIGSFYIIFVTVFLVLIIGLVLVLVLKVFGHQQKTTACSHPVEKTFVDSVAKNNDIIYKVNFKGNKECFLDTWLTWNKPTSLALWVYDPSGNITTYNNTPDKSYLKTDVQEPIKKGVWKFVVKNSTQTKVLYKGSIGFR